MMQAPRARPRVPRQLEIADRRRCRRAPGPSRCCLTAAAAGCYNGWGRGQLQKRDGQERERRGEMGAQSAHACTEAYRTQAHYGVPAFVDGTPLALSSRLRRACSWWPLRTRGRTRNIRPNKLNEGSIAIAAPPLQARQGPHPHWRRYSQRKRGVRRLLRLESKQRVSTRCAACTPLGRTHRCHCCFSLNLTCSSPNRESIHTFHIRPCRARAHASSTAEFDARSPRRDAVTL